LVVGNAQAEHPMPSILYRPQPAERGPRD